MITDEAMTTRRTCVPPRQNRLSLAPKLGSRGTIGGEV